MLSLVFKGHTDKISSLSTSTCGQYVASASADGTARVWEVSSSRCLHVFNVKEPVLMVAFNPNPERRGILAILTATCVRLVFAGIVPATGADDDKDACPEYSAAMSLLGRVDITAVKASETVAEWRNTHTLSQQGLRITPDHDLRRMCWHNGGDYFATVQGENEANSVLLHRLSLKSSQAPFTRSRGVVQDVAFHPKRPFFFVATKRHVRIYNLQKQQLIKKLQCPAKWILNLSVHPSGDHVLVGTADRRVCWYDLDLSQRPFKTLK